MMTVDDAGFAVIVAAPVVVIVFSAAWCQPCARGVIEAEAAGAAAGLPVFVADIDLAPDAAMAARVRGVPTISIWRDGVMAGAVLGDTPRDKLKTFFDKLKGN
jgi:thioredoxin 1